MRTVEEIKASISTTKDMLPASINDEYHLGDYRENLLKNLEDELRFTLTADIPLDRLEAICAAEKDGRLVTLSCKVGDTVYYPYAGRVIPKRITQYREILRKSEAIDRWYCLEFSTDETFDAEDIGETVFLTRAEAEKALGKEQG